MPAKQQYGSVWARQAAEESRPPARAGGPSRQQIVRAALEILDAGGLDALSMRALGTRLGMGATSIYWYVANKNELLDLALDEVFGEIAVPGSALIDWREAVSVFAHSLRRALLRHPWSLHILGRRPNIGPRSMAVTERTYTLFDDAGFHADEIDDAVTTVMAYVIGIASAEAGWLETLSAGELSAAEWQAQHEPAIRSALRDLPRLRAHYDRKGPSIDPRTGQEERFDYGLGCMLDGLAARL
ncbi:TetR family transcriptional regulator [Microtetraspora sp. NBRC 13810]|uniref:TetR/AcrR family transcriptional regulator n=1 Tax=Microtetraspora sp. NBRC 13810 TaxID=3030990 RepID=UPI0024A2342A|nr:TetR/AcrR family transcriptional regulator [Microtetraspora sp. NBRC 13810]GLW08397.1 TetR family transcriptional regulator [Microtetraspora sp. NBRC 13810]